MKNRIITIGREYGSNGLRIGHTLTKQLSIPCYDKTLIHLASQKSGLPEGSFEDIENRVTGSFLFNIAIGNYDPRGFLPEPIPVTDQAYIAQFQAVKELADKGPCVIIGRCADYVLRDRKDCLNVFLHAPLEQRKKRVEEEYKIAPEKCASEIRKMDKARAAYYNHYTGQKWGEAKNYHLTIDTSIGEETVLKILCTLANA